MFDAEVPSQGAKKGGAGKGGKSGAPVLTGKEKAQAIIAQALAEVRQDLTRKANNTGQWPSQCSESLQFCSPNYSIHCLVDGIGQKGRSYRSVAHSVQICLIYFSVVWLKQTDGR